jgi:hypothetical protein
MIFHARQRAIQEVDNAIAMLATPEDPAVQETLACRFRGASDAQIAKIRSVLERVRSELPLREYYCVRGMGELTKSFSAEETGGKAQDVTVGCVGEEAASFGYSEITETAKGQEVSFATYPPVALCDNFFTGPAERQATPLIHESVHAAGFGTDPTYQPKCGLDPSTAMTIPDSYAMFASELFARKGNTP